MKNIIKAFIISTLCAAVLSASGCAQPEAAPPVVSDSAAAVSQTDVLPNPPTAVAKPEGPKENKSCDHSSCTITESLTRRCDSCGHETDLMPSGYITEKETIITAGGIMLTVDAGVYVPGNVETKVEKLIGALEEASGLSFSDAKYNKNTVNVHVAKVVPPEEPNGSSEESEAAGAWAVSGDSRYLEISAGDLFLGNSYAIAHELSHTLNFSNSSKYFCQVAREGFAEYNCYKAVRLLEETDPEAAYSIDTSHSSLYSLDIYEPSAVYTQSMEYWMEHDFPYEYSGNGSYSLGFRFMAFLDDVYGDYAKWITLSDSLEGDDQNFPIEQQTAAFRLSYGEDVFDKFYSWLKENEDRFAVDYFTPIDYDLTGADAVTIYPFFMSFDCPTDLVNIMSHVKYSDLYIDLEEAKKYLKDYKGRDIDDLELNIEWLDEGCAAELFDADGRTVGTITESGSVALDNVSYLLLKGEGTLTSFNVSGYRGYPENE